MQWSVSWKNAFVDKTVPVGTHSVGFIKIAKFLEKTWYNLYLGRNQSCTAKLRGMFKVPGMNLNLTFSDFSRLKTHMLKIFLIFTMEGGPWCHVRNKVFDKTLNRSTAPVWVKVSITLGYSSPIFFEIKLGLSMLIQSPHPIKKRGHFVR